MSIVPYLQAEEDVRFHKHLLVRPSVAAHCSRVCPFSSVFVRPSVRPSCRALTTTTTTQTQLEDEAKVMKGVKGWKVGESVYNTKEFWVPPTPLGHPRLDCGEK